MKLLLSLLILSNNAFGDTCFYSDLLDKTDCIGLNSNTTTFHSDLGIEHTTGRINGESVNTRTFKTGVGIDFTTGKIGDKDLKTNTYNSDSGISRTRGKLGDDDINITTYKNDIGFETNTGTIGNKNIYKTNNYIGDTPSKKSYFDNDYTYKNYLNLND